MHIGQAAPQKWPSAESQALGEDSVQLLTDDPEGLGCEQGGPEPTVHAHRQGGSESRYGRHGPRAHHRAPQGCAGPPCRQALGSTQQSAPRESTLETPTPHHSLVLDLGQTGPGRSLRRRALIPGDRTATSILAATAPQPPSAPHHRLTLRSGMNTSEKGMQSWATSRLDCGPYTSSL